MEENKVFIFSGEFLDYDCQLNTKMIKNAMKLLKNIDMERYFSLASSKLLGRILHKAAPQHAVYPSLKIRSPPLP